MVHFGILCPASTSHLNTMLPLAQELKERGHRLTAVGLLDTKARAQAAGLDFQANGLEEYPIGSTATAMSELGKLTDDSPCLKAGGVVRGSHPEYAGQLWEFFRDGEKLKSFTKAERVIAWLEKQ